MYAFKLSKLLVAVFFYCNIRKKNASQCVQLSKKPYFDVEQVRGKTWKIYHTWEMKMDNKCVAMTFRNATQKIINSFYHDMKEYVEYQPDWNAATMVVTMGNSDLEILLIAEIGAVAGTFIGVPNMAQTGPAFTFRSYVFRLAPLDIDEKIPLLRFFMKLLHDGGGYLLMADCDIGVTTLSARKKPRFRAEVSLVAASLRLGKGDPACIDDKTKKH